VRLWRSGSAEAEDARVITIQSAMLVILGFLGASLLGLLVASAFWARAVRLTTLRLKQSLPVSEPEIKADRDRLKAEYAIKVHKLEKNLDQAKLQRARHLIDINRRDADISSLETDVVALKADLEENQNARRVLEQTVADRLPKVEARLTEAKRLLFAHGAGPRPVRRGRHGARAPGPVRGRGRAERSAVRRAAAGRRGRQPSRVRA